MNADCFEWEQTNDRLQSVSVFLSPLLKYFISRLLPPPPPLSAAATAAHIYYGFLLLHEHAEATAAAKSRNSSRLHYINSMDGWMAAATSAAAPSAVIFLGGRFS